MGLVLLVKWIKYQIMDYRALTNKKVFFSIDRFKYLILTLLFVLVPLLTVNYTDVETLSLLPKFDNVFTTNAVYSIIVSFFISFLWLYYIYKLDIFNKEKKYHILLVLLLAIGLTLLTHIPYDFIHKLGFTQSENPFDSFIYCVFGIGLIEETIKMIPLLIILFFSKAIDEPFDYILYASTSALGFAFIENATYLNIFGLEIINARALYATVAHMSFSSMIGYGLFLVKFKHTKYNAFLILLAFFFLAVFSHGFYDFWIMNKSVTKYSWLTTLFLLINIHIWFSIKNNTINASNFYDERIKVNNDRLKIYLIVGLLSIFMFSYLYMAFSIDSVEANLFFKKMVAVYGFIIFYIITTLSKYNLVKGLVKPFKLTLKFLFPKMRKRK